MATDEDWASTPQEKVLDTIYESLLESGHQHNEIFGVTETRSLAQLYVVMDGECWEILAVKHPHAEIPLDPQDQSW